MPKHDYSSLMDKISIVVLVIQEFQSNDNCSKADLCSGRYSMGNKRRYSDYNAYLKAIYGERVQKIVVDVGLDCPNRDGSISRGGCIYCNSHGSGSGLWNKGLSITEQIELGRKAMTRRYKARKFM
ncbi:MAG: hypothetical protein HQK67_12465, partial [Desulfamplus sp.]|nr:hypothetical protein [Desulfamplus sp.]